MCRFQKEISSKIQEKKASGIIAAAEVVARGNTSGLDEEPDGTTRPLQDQDEEQQHRCRGDSVGVACSACRFLMLCVQHSVACCLIFGFQKHLPKK